MKEEPVISAAAIKAALLLIVLAAIGFGVYALAGGDADLPDIDLPEIDLPEIETTTDEPGAATDTTAPQDDEPPQPPLDPFTAAGLRAALAALEAEVGPGADLTRVSINSVQTIFHVRDGEQPRGYGFDAAGRELRDVDVYVTGSGPLSEIDFPVAVVRPRTIARLARGTRLLLRAPDAEFDVFDLSRGPFDNALAWTVTATARERSFSLRAGPGGGGLEDISGGGVELPPAALEARETARCIEEAAGDSEAIFECLD